MHMPVAEGGCDGEGGVQAPEDGAEEKQLANPDVDGEAGEVEPERGQVAVGVQGTHALQSVDGSLCNRSVDIWWNQSTA